MLWEAFKLAIQSVRRNVLRSILTLLGIVIGVGAVIAMVTIGNGTTQKVTDDLSKLGSNMLIVRPGADVRPAAAEKSRTSTSATSRRCATSLPTCAPLRPATRAARIVYGADNYATTVTGTDSEFLHRAGLEF